MMYNIEEARLKGYTREVYAACDITEGPYLVKPDADLDGEVIAFDIDMERFVRLYGWLWAFD
jgi:hypothetical protein